MSVNKVILIGRLGAEPESKVVSSGQTVTRLSLATSRTWKDSQGVKQEKTEWHRVVVWGRMAEVCAQYLAKGRQVYVEGELQTRSWEDNEGQKKYTTEIVAQKVQFLGADGARSENNAEPKTPDSQPVFNEEDLPF